MPRAQNRALGASILSCASTPPVAKASASFLVLASTLARTAGLVLWGMWGPQPVPGGAPASAASTGPAPAARARQKPAIVALFNIVSLPWTVDRRGRPRSCLPAQGGEPRRNPPAVRARRQ